LTPWVFLRSHSLLLKAMVLVGCFTLLIQAGSQGILPFDLVPTAYRDLPVDRLESSEVEAKSFEAWFRQAEQSMASFPAEVYQQAPLYPPLTLVTEALHSVLEDLDYPTGREVKAIKDMEGLTLLMGLAYGGPAFHDVVSGEVALASAKDLPSSKAWRWWTVVHELTHAQGFTREMDAEVLTFLTLRALDHPLGKPLATWMALSKTQRPFSWPEVMKTEWKDVQQKREALHQPWVQGLKRLLQGAQVQNSGEKYGDLASKQVPPPTHEYFRVVLAKWTL
jgi:hypothetical protein